jgi:hypothetical protein
MNVAAAAANRYSDVIRDNLSQHLISALRVHYYMCKQLS